MRYIGFDIGDGESAVAVYQHNSGIEPIIQPIGGSRSLISAVGTIHGEIVVGEQAYTGALSDGLSVRFKSRFTDDPRSYDTIVQFVRGVLNALRETNAIREDDQVVVGCPAGWNVAARARYQDLLIRAGLPHPQVISESRAAFLYAKYAKTVALNVDILRQSALVIDIGSSTLDFAYIVDGRESGVGTFGDTHLGGGLIDAELLRRSVARNRESNQIQHVFDDSHNWYSYCELEARKLKELYYTRVIQEPDVIVKKQVRLLYRGAQKLQLTLDAQEADRIVNEPMDVLHGRSFTQALQEALTHAKQITELAPPKLVMLTGGASRMPFLQALCRDTFSNAVIVICPEPEFSIAKGLAYAGWVDENLRAFRQAIHAEITDERVSAIATSALPELIPSVVRALVELALTEAAIPVVSAWKRGDIDTLAQMNDQLQRRIERVLSSPMAEEALSPELTLWMEGLSTTLQAMLDPICDRYNVPRDEMRLSFVQAGDAANVDIQANQVLGLNLIGTLVGVVVSVVFALLGGGGGVALIATGPIGMLAGAALGAVISALGWPAITDALTKANLPRVFRRINVQKRLQSESTRKTLRDALSRELNKSDDVFSHQVVTGFTKAFQRYLYQIAQAAEIPIQ